MKKSVLQITKLLLLVFVIIALILGIVMFRAYMKKWDPTVKGAIEKAEFCENYEEESEILAKYESGNMTVIVYEIGDKNDDIIELCFTEYKTKGSDDSAKYIVTDYISVVAKMAEEYPVSLDSGFVCYLSLDEEYSFNVDTAWNTQNFVTSEGYEIRSVYKFDKSFEVPVPEGAELDRYLKTLDSYLAEIHGEE